MSSFSEFVQFMFMQGGRPRLDDIAQSLSRRTGGKPFAVLNIGYRGVRVARAQFRRGKLLVDQVTTFQRELGDREFGDSVPPDAISAVKERSPKGLVVVGLSARVVVRTVDRDDAQIERVKDLGGAPNEDDTERATYIWQENGTKMIRMHIPTNIVRFLERALADQGLKVARVLPMPYVLLNGYLALFENGAAPSKNNAHRVPMILDDSHIQSLTTDRATGTWRQLRATPVFSAKVPDGTNSVKQYYTQSIRDFVRSVCQGIKTNLPIELAVLDSGVAPEGWACLNDAVTEINEAKETPQPIELTRVVEATNIDLHALCLHP